MLFRSVGESPLDIEWIEVRELSRWVRCTKIQRDSRHPVVISHAVRRQEFTSGPELERNMLAQLIPIDGSETILLKKDVTLVGRKSRLCDLVLDRGSVSKLHCLIVKTDGLLFIRDLGSTNGTKVNENGRAHV